MKKNIIIHEGFTNNYLIPGAFAIVLSLLSILFIGTYALIPLVFGIGIVSGSNGLEIDLKEKKYRKYGSFIGIKIGVWESMDKPTFAKLILSSESKSMGFGEMAGFIQPNQGKLKSITYDIYIKTESEQKIRLYDFLEYKTAKKALKALETTFEIDAIDVVREKLIENREKRNSKR